MNDLLTLARGVLETTPARWNALITALPEEALSARPLAKEWSALECLQHMIDTERLFVFRLQAFLEGRDFPAFNPDSQGTKADPSRGPEALAAEFARLRAESLSLIAQVTPADLERKARHAELGPVVLREMLNEWAGHDLNHTVQAERALMQPFIHGSGPWKIYFSDQLMED